jgi:2-polyprenyl-3-methyl-5-hydroxy-6-metoxy-1,4-benzoquinol methylase
MRFPWRSMKARSADLEFMDLDTCDPVMLARTIRQFALLNRLFSASRRLAARLLFPLMETGRTVPYTLLDLGAGGCDVDIAFVKVARKRGIGLSVTAVDRDDRVLSTAREAIRGYPEITAITADVRDLAALGEFDFIFCNHLLHHLSLDDIGRLLERIERQARIAYLLNDLKRSAWALAGYSLFSALFLPPSLAYYDGKLSIRRGFLEQELRKVLDRHVPDAPVTILRAFPARLAIYRRKYDPIERRGG